MIVENDTGEIIFKDFVNIFFNDIEKIFSLSGSEKALLKLMIKSILLSNGNSINMTSKRKKEYASKIGLKTYRSVTKMLKNMELKDVIRKPEPNECPSRFIINPKIFFECNEFNQVEIILTYSNKKKDIKVVTSNN